MKKLGIAGTVLVLQILNSEVVSLLVLCIAAAWGCYRLLIATGEAWNWK